jgi:hypothetical protein
MMMTRAEHARYDAMVGKHPLAEATVLSRWETRGYLELY